MNPVNKILGKFDISKNRTNKGARCKACGHPLARHFYNDCKGLVCEVESCQCEDGEFNESD
jgi:hypothetical protein